MVASSARIANAESPHSPHAGQSEVRNLLTRGDRRTGALVARHAVGTRTGEIFVVTTEAQPDSQYLTTTTLLFWANVRRCVHHSRREAIVDHSREIRRLLSAADEWGRQVAAG